MTSSLNALYTAQRSLSLNQIGLSIVNDNISNVNTDGYSRQTLNISEAIINGTNGQTTNGVNANSTGAVLDSIDRNRNSYLDSYYRSQNSITNYYQEYSNSTDYIESVINSLSGSGINNDLNTFYTAASSLSSNPTDLTARTALVTAASTVASDLNTMSSTLTSYRDSVVGDGTDANKLSQSQITTNCNSLNDKLKSLADINKSISLSSSSGSTPNDLLDQRDNLLDEISNYIPINYTLNSNNTVSVSLGNVSLVSGSTVTGSLQTTLGDSDNPAIVTISDSSGNLVVNNANSLITSGSIGADLTLGGSSTDSLSINSYINNLNTLAVELAKQVNTIQEGGQYLDNSTSPATLSSTDINDIFVGDSSSSTADYTTLTAANITINQNIVNDPYKIAAASSTAASTETGDGSNALLLYQSKDKNIVALGNQSAEDYITSLNGKIGTQIDAINSKLDSQNTILSQITTERTSATGVSLDEELTNLIVYQRGYEASAKILDAVNKSLQTIIGVVS